MTMTVADVIGLPVVARGEPEVLSARRWEDPIRWVHVGDVADLSALLQGGELVLTTGAGLAADPRRYLQGLADAGAVGVVVELGTAMTAVPQWVVAHAERLDLALVALHRQIKFVAVTEVVHRRIVAAQYDEVAFDRRVHETFTELSMKRASPAGIVDAAARILGEPVVLEDLAHQALAVAPGGDAAATLLQNWERRSRASAADGDWAVTSVGPRGEEWGRLIVPAAPPDRARATMVLERAAAALALHRMIERNRSGLHQQAQSGLIDDVVAGRITDEREAAARAHALGLRRSARYLPLVVRVDRGAATMDPVVAQRRNVELLDAVAHTVNAAGHTALCSIRRDGEIGALVALDPGRGGWDRALTALGERVHAEVRRRDGGARSEGRSVCAVGDPAAEIVEAIHGLGEAAHVGEVAIAMHGHGRAVYRASDVRLRGLIALLRDDPRVQQFAETELRALLLDDDERVPSNLEVLRQYLQVAGNKAALAQRLHMSRPALYKRLAAIGRTLGVDLDDAESMTSLHVAVLILDAQRRAAPAVLTRGG
ncbi:PucR family transcriptional regulator [Mycolicibacterium monacense]|nr:PucR family transcriptional regulator [Mycolicibacterium monacense]MDA4101831.1 PucR family transcriptional regulator [Mycolicibacterium monacense DSM 44395]ORB12057.1 PucR family transcriptional regulator [Mycolicibacterium monacense DSM 44395]QHP84204.1 PucR family transcriptional regulator [Mycolicibacterium monacense DSM 44395]